MSDACFYDQVWANVPDNLLDRGHILWKLDYRTPHPAKVIRVLVSRDLAHPYARKRLNVLVEAQTSDILLDLLTKSIVLIHRKQTPPKAPCRIESTTFPRALHSRSNRARKRMGKIRRGVGGIEPFDIPCIRRARRIARKARDQDNCGRPTR